MIGEPRIGLRPLAELSRRLALSLGAGVDVRTVWMRETNSAQGFKRRHLAAISDGVARGESMTDALATTGKYFPEFFRELVHVGESSGHLPEVFRRLADHYEHQSRLRSQLVRSLTWPLLELALALGVVGLLIWLMGAIPQLAKSQTDLLGFGLTGTRGLAIYLIILSGVGLAIFLVYRAAARGALWVASVERTLMRVPKLGRVLETLALARLTWAMHVTLFSGMELRNALRMSLASTESPFYKRHTRRVMAAIGAGNEVHEAFRATRAFPPAFLDAVQVGEDSGQLVESMQNLSGHYQEEAKAAMNTLTVLMGLVVTALVGAVIIFLIFRIFSFYVGTINDALKMR